MQALKITYLQRRDVNDEKWNACIASSVNGLIYAYSFYLDAMTDNWDALVLGDYEAVMPLPWRKKWGITYLYYPFLTAQLGVFSKELSVDIFEDFLNAVPKKFEFWDISFNQQNLFAVKGYPLYERSNYVLSLNKTYEDLYKAYRENVRRNVKKSLRYGCCVKTDVLIDEIIALAKLQAQKATEKGLENFKNLFALLDEKGMAKTYGVVSQKDELLASAVFLFSNNRAYYILVGNHPNGRTLGASHALIDAFIKDHAGQDLLLDFEGSDVRNLQFFYSSFGAKEEKYAAIKLNRLPWWVRLVKQDAY
ncbi:GNAT family N-acetyltransferase [Flavisolibacter ginsenosidimutans]|nr:GNAT family N-acetyltransferase [Flavisolibacter ginsenosidimutans]